MTQKTRLVIIVVVAVALLAGARLVLLVGDSRSDHDVRKVRATAATAHISGEQLLSSLFNDNSTTVAGQLHVDPVDVALAQTTPGPWCAAVRIQHFGTSARHVYFMIASDGHFTEVKSC